MLTAEEKIDFNFALKVQSEVGLFGTFEQRAVSGLEGAVGIVAIAPPILANLSQMMIFEQGDDRHSSSTICQV
ncbi:MULTISPECIES: hypothetical protein [unclassified Microcoleus]|uniref:hypothetical protein n=1 Tax=unclassified Microcoleus TaxID=2642155 RepID=UPI002FD48289